MKQRLTHNQRVCVQYVTYCRYFKVHRNADNHPQFKQNQYCTALGLGLHSEPYILLDNCAILTINVFVKKGAQNVLNVIQLCQQNSFHT